MTKLYLTYTIKPIYNKKMDICQGLIQKCLIGMGVNMCIRYTLKCIVGTVTNTSNIEDASFVGGEKGGEMFILGGGGGGSV